LVPIWGEAAGKAERIVSKFLFQLKFRATTSSSLHARWSASSQTVFHSLGLRAILFVQFISGFYSRSVAMEWTTPQHEEIDLNCEISSYANAEL
jgi:hypothetical protein